MADGLTLSASAWPASAPDVLGILKAGHSPGSEKLVLLTAGIAAIIASWGVVQTTFTLRYAALSTETPKVA